MTPLSHLLPPLPGLTALSRTYAPWAVWSGSVANPVRFAPLAKKAAVKLWHRARDFDRRTHQAGRHGGAVGPSALAVLEALIFDFLNHRTGRLDPSYTAIAAKAGVCVRTVATALARLRELGILNWVRRCAENCRDGRFVLEQETNAYAVLPEASLLRRIAAGERANDQIGWENVVEEIEDVGGREREKVTKAFIRAIRHKLCLLGWPHSVAVHLWEPEVRIHLATAPRRYRNSMRQYITSESWQEDYQSALLETARHMADEWPLRVALLSACPWSLDELLAEGEAARHWKPA